MSDTNFFLVKKKESFTEHISKFTIFKLNVFGSPLRVKTLTSKRSFDWKKKSPNFGRVAL